MRNTTILALSLFLTACSFKPNPGFDPESVVDAYMDEQGVLTQEDLNNQGTLDSVDEYLNGKDVLTSDDLKDYATKNDLATLRAELTTSGGVVQLPSAIQPGTRLQAKIGATPDGARIFLGWYDSERDIDCEFSDTTEGYRCLPLDNGPETPPGPVTWNAKYPTVQPMDFYADTACTAPYFKVRGVGSNAAPGTLQKDPKYAFTWEDSTRQKIGNKVYRLVECTGSLFYKLEHYVNGDVCTSTGSGTCQAPDPRDPNPINGRNMIGMVLPQENPLLLFVGMDVVLESAGN